ncbi:hypothetical protein IIA15_02090 [candidate division TA06 bacterium]|nr:hypothetical protein [candidate division TA06 bacterium]
MSWFVFNPGIELGSFPDVKAITERGERVMGWQDQAGGMILGMLAMALVWCWTMEILSRRRRPRLDYAASRGVVAAPGVVGLFGLVLAAGYVGAAAMFLPLVGLVLAGMGGAVVFMPVAMIGSIGVMIVSHGIGEFANGLYLDRRLPFWPAIAGGWAMFRARWGEMVQMGRIGDWLEGRGPELVLMGYIDDATNRVFARFYEYEGTFPAMDSFRAYIKRYGIPQSVYLDKHTTYKSTRRLTLEEELQGICETKSQFERALDELGVEIIHADSPQAKGRIERLFGTLQDRLIKEMRLAGIQSKEEANRFLKEYLPTYNQRFSLVPAKDVNLHRKIPKGTNLLRILSIKTKRGLRNDFTILYNKQLYQIETTLPHTRIKSVVVEERLDGTMHIIYNNLRLKYRKIDVRPLKWNEQKPRKPRKMYIPPKDHPWRRFKTSSSKDRYYEGEKALSLVHTK